MKNTVFILIDSCHPALYMRYQHQLKIIHQNLLKKLSSYEVIILGDSHSQITEKRFDSLKFLYAYLSDTVKGKDLIILDAYAALISLDDTKKVLEYSNTHIYDVCLTENLPEGFVPMIISKDFIGDFHNYIEEDKKVSSSLKDAVDWEFQGIDVGVYLSPSLLVMERVDFLPVNKGAIEWILEDKDTDLNLDNIDEYLKENPEILRHCPQYVAIELHPQTDGFNTRALPEGELSIDTFRKFVTDIDEFAPEALISLGIWGDPFCHSQFKDLFSLLEKLPNRVLVESRALFLSEELCSLVFSRPNTELIFDISFTTEEDFKKYKKSNYTLQEIRTFIHKIPNKEQLWIRLTRTHETEYHIKSFLKEWQDLMPRVIINKADSFGKESVKVVDLAPLQRHSCYALRRELTILNDGSVLLCRQSKDVIGNLNKKSLKELWTINEVSFLVQEQKQFDSCSICKTCDDWWIWN